MRRFFAKIAENAKGVSSLTGQEALHAARVLRVQPGDELIVLNGQGDVYQCRVLSVHKSEIALETLSHEHREPLPVRVTLFQAIPKGGVMEDIVQQATELGAYRIFPILTERTEVKITSRSAGQAKVEKWLTTAAEACKQCGNPWLPIIEEPSSMAQVLSSLGGGEMLHLVASLEERTQPLLQTLGEVLKDKKEIGIWIGPEGDFSRTEYALLRQNASAYPVTLSPLVLRCGTAAISAIATTLCFALDR